MSDRVAVVRDGRVLYTSEAQRMTQFQMIALASGVGHSSEIREDT